MQITKHIHAIKIPFQLTISPTKNVDRFVYAYMLYGKNIWLIDCGVAGSERTIFDYIKQTGRKEEDIEMLMLTHSHPDHIGAASEIKSASGCTIAAHYAERAWIEDTNLQFSKRPVPGFHNLIKESVEVGSVLEDGDILKMEGGPNIKVFHTPGHSSGSISLLVHEDNALITGDAVPIAGDIPIYEDVTETVASLKKIKSIVDINTLLPAWSEPVEGQRVYKTINESLEYIQHIHEIIRGIENKSHNTDPMYICAKVIETLGLPTAAVNALVAKSFISHMKLLFKEDILSD